jgi:hypothetical protein
MGFNLAFKGLILSFYQLLGFQKNIIFPDQRTRYVSPYVFRLAVQPK